MEFHRKLYITVLAIIMACVAVPSYAKESNAKEFVVVIDAGHGGKDVGAVDNGVREKDINLGVALQIQSLLKKKHKGIKVVMTRDEDNYLTLQQRADVANKSKGDLFLSIHTNSVDKSNRNRRSVAGSSVYALGLHKDESNMKVAQRENSVIELEQNYEQKYSGFDPQRDESYIIFEMAQKKNLSQSIRFANDVQKRLVESGRKDRGVHQAGFWVLWATSMPSVLVELDFICNPEQAKYISSDKGQREMAASMVKAIENYYEGWLRSQGVYVKDISQTSESETDVLFAEEISVESPSDVVLLASKNSSKKTDVAPSKGSAQQYYSGSRRRRGNAARINSSNRMVETSEIPLHTESERRGVVERIVPEKSASKPSEEVAAHEKADKKARKQKNKKEKKEKEEKKTKRQSNAHNAKIDKFVKVYKIQILASAELLREDNSRFKGLKPVTVYRDNNLYKYYYGESRSETEIESLLRDVKKKIPDAFVVSSFKSASQVK